MPLTYTQVANFLKDVLEDTSGIGVIYTTRKDFRSQEDIEENCVAGVPPRLNVWFIRRARVQNSLQMFDGRPVPLGAGARIHEFIIEGWYGYIHENLTANQEDTEVTFQDLCTGILDSFQGKKTRANLADTQLFTDSDEISITIDKDKFMGGIIAHYTTISITLNELYYSVSYM